MKIAAAWWSLSGDGFWPNGSAVNYLPYWERWLDRLRNRNAVQSCPVP